MPDERTIQVYSDRAADYAAFTKTDGAGRLLRGFIQRLQQGALVLDYGCGPGTDSALMMQAGLKVEALDATPAMVELAQSKGVNARLGTFFDLDAVARYDGIWASFSLLHAPRADMPSHLAAIKRALKPGGHVQIAVKTGTGERRDSIGRLYTFYMPDDLCDLIHDAGMIVDEIHEGRDKGLDGGLANWVSVAAHG